VRSNRASTAPTAAWLATLGYATLTIDFRGHGQSEMADGASGSMKPPMQDRRSDG
jgi:alpha-beta hydrolase superfamily lysophospholipase